MFDQTALGSRKTGTFVEVVVEGTLRRAFIPKPLMSQMPFDARRHLESLAEADAAIEGFRTLSSGLSVPELLQRLGTRTEGRQDGRERQLHRRYQALKDGYLALSESGLTRDVLCVLHRQAASSDIAHEAGVLRNRQNWVSTGTVDDAAFLAPPLNALGACLDDLLLFSNEDIADGELHPLVRAAVIQAQFFNIHPFLDGNGRTMRVLFPLLLTRWGYLSAPTLDMSMYLRQNRGLQSKLLRDLCENGDWFSYVEFVVRGVTQTLNRTVMFAKAAERLVADGRGLVNHAETARLIAGLAKSA